MSEACQQLHELLNRQPRLSFPFDVSSIARNGVYVLFERGESAHGGDRIVRIGTHTGVGNLGPRLAEHFLKENKDRSIFRKNIGRALLKRAEDPFFDSWQLDLTTRAMKDLHGAAYDRAKLRQVEIQVTEYMRENLSFAVVPCDDQRLTWEAALIAIVSGCDECGPSATWLGLHSPVARISGSGLWLLQGVGKPLSSDWDTELFEAALKP